MKTVLKSILTLIVIPLALAFAVEVLSPFAPETLPALQRLVTAMTEWAGFPWVLAGSLGLLVGMWLDRWAGAFDGRHPLTRSGKAKGLADEAEMIGLMLREVTGESYEASLNYGSVATRAVMICKKLQRIGVYFPTEMNAVKDGVTLVGHQLRCIAPALREGDVELANAVILQTVRTGRDDAGSSDPGALQRRE